MSDAVAKKGLHAGGCRVDGPHRTDIDVGEPVVRIKAPRGYPENKILSVEHLERLG